MNNSSALFRLIAQENLQQYHDDIAIRKQHIEQTIHPYTICIIGADHPSAYSLFPNLLSDTIIPNRNINLRLLTNDSSKVSYVQALAMEIEDLACKQFYSVEIGLINETKSFEDTDLIIVLDDYFFLQKQKYFQSLFLEKTRLKQTYDDANLFDDEYPPFVPEKMTYDLKQAFDYYQNLAQNIQSTIQPDCHILLACYNSIMIATKAFIETITNIPDSHIIGLARTIENQAKARIGKKLQVDLKSTMKIQTFSI